MSGTRDPIGLVEDRPSAGRLLLGVVVGPLVVGVAMTLFAFLIESLSRPAGADALTPALSRAATIFGYAFAFTVAVALPFLVALRVLDLRGPVPWTLCGALAGALAALAYTTLEGVPVAGGLLMTFAMLGWGEFLVIRWVAGMR